MHDGSQSVMAQWREERTRLVQQQIDAGNQHDLPALIATFFRPSYELVAIDSTATGATAVADLLGRFMHAFPNLYATIFATYYADVAVIMEGQWVGTQTGAWLGLPASGRVINLPFVTIFKFDEDRLMSTKVYFDSGLMMRQLTE